MQLVKSHNSPLKIKAGKTYRGKMPTLLSSIGTFNDRTIVWVSADNTKIKFISAELKLGEVSKAMDIRVFAHWAKMEVAMHPVMSRHYQMMCYKKIKWKKYGLQEPKKSKKLKSAYG